MVSLSIGVFVLWRVRRRSMNTPNFEPELTLNQYLNQYSTRFNSSDVYTIAFIQVGTAFGAKILSQDCFITTNVLAYLVTYLYNL